MIDIIKTFKYYVSHNKSVIYKYALFAQSFNLF